MKIYQLGKFIAISGTRKKTRGKNPTCSMCVLPILPGQKGVVVKSLGEYGREFHLNCIEKFAMWVLEK